MYVVATCLIVVCVVFGLFLVLLVVFVVRRIANLNLVCRLRLVARECVVFVLLIVKLVFWVVEHHCVVKLVVCLWERKLMFVFGS